LSESSALSFMEIGPLVLRAYATLIQAAVAACPARRVKRCRSQKLIAWRLRAAPKTLRLSSTVIIMGLYLCGLRQGRAIIGCELFNPLAGQLMLNVKALPWLVETEFLIENRLAGRGVFEIAVGRRKAVASPIVQDLRRHRHQVGFQQKTVKQLF